MGITAELCEKIVATGWNDLSEEAIQHTRRIMLDGIAVAVAGTIQEEAPEVLAKHVRNLGGTPESTVINFGFKTSPVEAAYVNGAAMHVLDFEPMWQPANHQVSTTLPAVLALAEQRQSNGRDCLTAMVKGIEIMGWVREASHQDDIKTVRFHPPGLVGPLGAADAGGEHPRQCRHDGEIDQLRSRRQRRRRRRPAGGVRIHRQSGCDRTSAGLCR